MNPPLNYCCISYFSSYDKAVELYEIISCWYLQLHKKKQLTSYNVYYKIKTTELIAYSSRLLTTNKLWQNNYKKNFFCTKYNEECYKISHMGKINDGFF